MRTPYVCTELSTNGRIVSSNSQPPGATPGPTTPFLDRFYSVPSPRPSVLIPPAASTSSGRIRREENHFIFAVGTKHHLCARNLNGSKMFTPYPFSRIRSGLLFCGSGKILASGKAENARLYPRGSSSLSTTPHQAKRFPQTPTQVLDLTLINLIYSLTKGSNFPFKNQKSKIKNNHGVPDFLRNFEIFYFHFQTGNEPTSSPWFLVRNKLSNASAARIEDQGEGAQLCTKFTKLHKITQRDLHLKPLKTSHLLLKTNLPPTPNVQKSKALHIPDGFTWRRAL
jgi:hypothetical protein